MSSSQNPSSNLNLSEADLKLAMAQKQERVIAKRAAQQKKKQEAERLAKEHAALEEQRKKLFEEADLDVFEDDLDPT